MDKYYELITRACFAEPSPSLLYPMPNKGKVEMIVQALEMDNPGGMLPVKEVKRLFSKLLGVPEDEIPNDHEEVLAFADLAADEKVDKLFAGTSKERVDAYHAELFPNFGVRKKKRNEGTSSLLRPTADRQKVTKMVQSIDIDGSGKLSLGEVKVLIGKMTGCDPAEIPDDHEEVVAFAGLSNKETPRTWPC